MLAIAKVKHPRYYVQCAQEQDDFDFTKVGEPPGRWLDTEGASFLGLSNTVVKRYDFLSLTQKHALNGRKLLETDREKEKEARGWDLTFCAPKSISLLWVIANDEVRQQIEQAHYKAVAHAIDYLEKEALKGEKSLVIASFQQGCSREGANPIPDPLLHTHAVAIPLVYDKQKRRMDSLIYSAGQLYRHKMASGALYRAELAAILQRIIGVPLEREKSWFEVKGFSREQGKHQALMNYFSSRRAQIEAHKPAGAIEAQKVAYQTRGKKGATLPRSQLFAEWQEVCREHDLHPEHFHKLLKAPLERSVIGQKWQEWRTLREAAKAIVRHQSHFTRRDLVRALAEAAQARGLNTTNIIRLTDKYLASRHVIKLGQIKKDVRYANKRMYKLEKQLLSQVKKLMTRQSYRVAFRHLRSAALEHGLTKEQSNALQKVTARGQIKVLSGISGTGKTHTLGAARQAWKNQGYTVIGVSLSGRQTQRLAEQTTKQPSLISELVGMKEQNITISRLLWEIERAEKSQRQYGSRSIFKSPLSNKAVVIADNAQAIGVTQMKRLVEAVRKAGAKLVLSGDVCQPQAHSHSGAFSAIAKRVHARAGAAKLTQIQRQEQEITKSIVKEVAQGDAFSALETLNAQGLLSISETKDQALMEIIKEWSIRGMQRPHDHLLIAHTSDDAEKLNRLAQVKLIDAGILKQTGTRVGRDFIRSGDRVHFQESAKTYGILRNNRGTVRHIDPVTKLAIVRLDSGKTRAINLRVYSGMTLGYAVTTPESKDVEVRHAYLLAEGSGRDSALLQVSRAKKQTKVYAYSVENELEAQLELAQKMSWSKQNELAVMMRNKQEQEQYNIQH